MNMLLTGVGGTLGKELKKQFPHSISPTSEELDITNKNSVMAFLKKENIDTVLHAAAITSIRECETDKNLAWKTNVEGTRYLVESLKNLNQNNHFIYISTACVFHGDQSMYTEESIPYPVNFYSITKLVGETIVHTIMNHLIIRTNFTAKGKWPYPKAFTDRYGTYLFADDVAKAIKELVDSRAKGIVHLVGDKVLSMYDLAKMTTDDVQPMTINEYYGPHLTMNMTLDTIRWKKYKISNYKS